MARVRLETNGTVGGEETTGTIEVDETEWIVEDAEWIVEDAEWIVEDAECIVEDAECIVEDDANDSSIAVRNVT